MLSVKPYLATYIRENSAEKNILLIVVLLVASLAFWKDIDRIISVTRLPIYAIGMMVAKNAYKKINWVQIIVCSILFVFGVAVLGISYFYFEPFMLDYGLYWYPFIFITPPLCLHISLISACFEKNKVLSKVLDGIAWVGKISFELYLVHIFVVDIQQRLLQQLLIEENVLIWFCTWGVFLFLLFF